MDAVDVMESMKQEMDKETGGIIENIIAIMPADYRKPVKYVEGYLEKYSVDLFRGTFFEEIAYFAFHICNDRNKRSGIQPVPYADFFDNYMREICPINKEYFFGSVGLAPHMFFACYNLLNMKIGKLEKTIHGYTCTANTCIDTSDLENSRCVEVDGEYIHVPIYLGHSAQLSMDTETEESRYVNNRLTIFAFRMKNVLKISQDIRCEYPLLYTLILYTMFETNIFPHGGKDKLITYQAKYNGEMMIAAQVLKEYGMPDLNTILKLSAAKYEGNKNEGVIDFYIEKNEDFDSKDKADRLTENFNKRVKAETVIEFYDLCEFSNNNVRSLRKYIELSSASVSEIFAMDSNRAKAFFSSSSAPC